MFEKRLRILLVLFAVGAAGLLVRLFELQIVRASTFQAATERALISRPVALPFVRGAIRDRRGEIIVNDEPSWDVRIDYAILAADIDATGKALERQVKRWKKNKRYGTSLSDREIAEAFRDEMESMWRDIARFSSVASPLSVHDFRARAGELFQRVQSIRRLVEQRRGFDTPVAEESHPHTMLSGLTRDESIVARELFAKYPWVHLEPSSTRAFVGNCTALAHVLGRVGRVNAEDVESDPNGDDPFARYLADERVGSSGVEFAAEQRLRGRRGEVTFDRDGGIVELIEAKDGQDVTITIDLELQNRLYQLLGEAVEDNPDSSGGSIVVLDVPTREVLAMVSYPSFDPREFDERYDTLRDDTDHLPLMFRAVANHYAPGSIVKPLVCLWGLQSGKINLDTREECTGYLFPDQRDRFRCWEMHGTNQRMAHGSVDVVAALTGSCNIFMYKLGERLGADRICEGFELAGLGKTSGIGFREEVAGINPNHEWWSKRRQTVRLGGDARNFSIGQGEVTITPIQAANLMACYATSKFRSPTLIRSNTPTPEWELPGNHEHWSAIRRGIYGVVNDPDGTAYKYAHFEHPQLLLCGKTGSATTTSWPTAYRVTFTLPGSSDVHESVVPARTRQDALDRVQLDHPDAQIARDGVEVARRWPTNPPSDDRYSHAWFAGYLQSKDAHGEPDESRPPKIAFAVLVEFGGSGGRTSGPLAKRIAGELVDLFGPELDVDPVPLSARKP